MGFSLLPSARPDTNVSGWAEKHLEARGRDSLADDHHHQSPSLTLIYDGFKSTSLYPSLSRRVGGERDKT